MNKKELVFLGVAKSQLFSTLGLVDNIRRNLNYSGILSKQILELSKVYDSLKEIDEFVSKKLNEECKE